MTKQSRWLETESERWISERIISAEQAGRIRGLYAAPPSALSWGLILFFGLGAVVVGLGIILLLAYNWADIPKVGKLALVFGALVAAHVAGLGLRRYADWRGGLAESLSLLGTMLFGAGIWLVAQIYNIAEHYPNGFLIWALAAVALAWVLDSVPQAIVAALLFAIWGGAESLDFSGATDGAAILLLVGVGPLVWRLRSRLLAAIALAALYWLVLCSAAHWGGAAAAFANALALGVLLVGVENLAPFDPGLGRVLRFFGLTGFVVCAYLLSFQQIVDDVLRWSHEGDAGWTTAVYRWALFALAALGWATLLVRRVRGGRAEVRNELWLLPIAMMYAQGASLWGMLGDGAFVSLAFNAICVGLALAWMVRGCRDGDLAQVVRGSVFLGALVLARYFDLFDSLAARGAVFLVFGAILFAEGFFYRRLRGVSRNGGAS